MYSLACMSSLKVNFGIAIITWPLGFKESCPVRRIQFAHVLLLPSFASNTPSMSSLILNMTFANLPLLSSGDLKFSKAYAISEEADKRPGKMNCLLLSCL